MIAADLFLTLVVPTCLAARPMVGLTVSGDAGVAPLIALNNDAVGSHLVVPLAGTLALESTTSVGFALIAHAVYTTSTYPPDAGLAVHPWFHGAQELSLGFALPLGQSGARTYALRLRPCVSAQLLSTA